MRKLVVSMNVTLDGFMAGPDNELDWHFQHWSADMSQSFSEELGKADTIILGRVTYCAMAAYWPYQCLSSAREDIAFGDMMNSYKKVVFSKTIGRPSWRNSEIRKESPFKAIAILKKQEGKDMIIYGSGKLVSTLIDKDLVDEYLLWVHPVLIGKGKSFFKKLHEKLELILIERKAFRSGVVALRYRRAH